MHNAAVSYSALGQNERAIEMFQRLIREYPDSAAAESARGKLRQLQGLN
jgi:TolA-binding protein